MPLRCTSRRGAQPVVLASYAAVGFYFSFSVVGIGVAAENAAVINQGGERNAAYVEQRGLANRASINQGDTASYSSAYILQVGSRNLTSIEQDNGTNNFAKAIVLGDRNGLPSAGAAGSTIAQRGSYNTALVLGTGSDNRFAVDQTGGNGANLVAVVQRGNGNTAAADQTNAGLAGDPALARQFATGAQALQISGPMLGLVQTVRGMLLGNANASLQIQVGDNNSATVEQTGQSNLAIQTQIGNDNIMSARQIGANNVLVHTQIGDGLVSPTITQTGGMTLVLTQRK